MVKFKILSGLIIYSVLASSCDGQQKKSMQRPNVLNSKSVDNNSTIINKEKVEKIYTQAITDFVSQTNDQKIYLPDTIYFAKRKNGLADDFPIIHLPEKIGNISIILVPSEEGEKLQKLYPRNLYINLMGWVDNESAEFIFVVFTNGFEHQFDFNCSYIFNEIKNEFVYNKSSIKQFDKKE